MILSLVLLKMLLGLLCEKVGGILNLKKLIKTTKICYSSKAFRRNFTNENSKKGLIKRCF